MNHSVHDDSYVIDDDETFWMSNDVTESLVSTSCDQILYSQACEINIKTHNISNIHSKPNESYFHPDEPLSPLKTFVSLNDLENDPNLSHMSDYFKSQFDGIKKTRKKAFNNALSTDDQDEYKKPSRKNTRKNESSPKKRSQYKTFSKKKSKKEPIDDE